MSESDEHWRIGDTFQGDFYTHTPDMYCVIDADSLEIEACNPTLADAIGHDGPDIVGASPDLFVDEASNDTFRGVRDELEQRDEVDNVEIQIVCADGSTFVGSLNATALREDGVLTSMCVSIRDISEIKETEQQLREKTEKLKRSNEQLEQFAYLASHDLQEPLRMVASYTQLLEKRYRDELDEQAETYIDYAVEGAERMKGLINDLLTYSRVGGGEDTFDAVDLEEIFDEVRANLKVRLAKTEGELRRGELPIVRGGHAQLLQLFQNLVENSIKFSGDATPVIEVEAEREGDTWRIAVSDNGIGFDPDNADRIFQIFQRLHERGEYEGTGTGLAIVKKIVDNHDGTIEVDSEQGEGATFEIELQAVDEGDLNG